MKLRNTFCALFIVTALFLTTFILYNNKSYSFGLTKQVSGSNGSKIIIYTDTETNSQISFEDAQKYFGAAIYEEMYDDGIVRYFEKGKETTYQNFIKGREAEQADNLASLYGSNAYRVHNTNEFNHAFDDIYQNLKIGEFHIIFSKYEAIDFNQVNTYYNEHYGVTSFSENYYTYSKKGMWEPNRFGIDLNSAKNNGELVLDTSSIRLSGNERVVLEDFANKLLPYLYGNGSEYDKILNTYSYILNTSSYLTDNGFINDLLASNTSAYDALINRKTTCIGYSIAFSYLMDKMGIESYIVDQSSADEKNQNFSSYHTYNIVKFNNKYYKLDLTGKVFLKAIGDGELYSTAGLNISKSDYYGNMTTNINYGSINNLLNESKSIKTTTTKRVEATTTNKTYSYSIPGGKKPVTSANTNNNTTRKTSMITTQDREGNIITVPVEIGENGEIIETPTTDPTENPTTEKKTEEVSTSAPKKKFKINYNYILFPLLIIGIITLIVLKIRDKKKISINSAEAMEILNRDIINKEEDK